MKAVLKASVASVGHNAPASGMPNTFDAALMQLATGTLQQKTGALGIAHRFAVNLEPVRIALAQARKPGSTDTVRDVCLTQFRTYPAGIALEAEKKAMPEKAARTDIQRTRWDNIMKEENAVANLIERACDVLTGITILKQTRSHVFIDEIGENTGVFACFVRSEATLKERDNTAFGSGALQAIPANVKYITAQTKTPDILARVLGKVGKGRKGKAGASKGGAVEALGASQLPPVLHQIDNTLAALTKDDGIGFTAGPEAIKTAHMLWARLDALMTAKQKDEARASFAAEGVAAKRKAAASKGKRTKLVNSINEGLTPKVPTANAA